MAHPRTRQHRLGARVPDRRAGSAIVIRVLEVLPTLKRAGAETMVANLVCRLDRRRFEPSIVTLFDASRSDLEESVRRCDIPVARLGKHGGLDLRMFWRLASVIRTFQPHVLHTHSYVLRYVLPVARCPIVHTVHNLADKEVDGPGQLIHRMAFRKGTTPVAVSEKVAHTFTVKYGFRPNLIPNGIDVSAFQVARNPGSVFTILSVGRLVQQKNPVLLAEAVQALQSPVRLLFAGEGELMPRLECFDFVELLGLRTDVPDLFATSHVFVLASDYEGHPLVVMEAMAAGIPVVATEVGGTPEIVGDAGILVPPRDRIALTQALETLQRDPALREELGRKARERSHRFHVDFMVSAYSDLFERVSRRADD